MLTYNALNGQSIFDVCLNTYGTIDNMRKLLDDNNIDSIDIIPFSGQTFIWDEALVNDANILSSNPSLIMATKSSQLPDETNALVDNSLRPVTDNNLNTIS
jgi:hypothetical protein